jgi:hypothetical protein
MPLRFRGHRDRQLQRRIVPWRVYFEKKGADVKLVEELGVKWLRHESREQVHENTFFIAMVSFSLPSF